jgi:DNA-binding CsgD family transcriptional regulator
MDLFGREAESGALAEAVADVRAGGRRTLGVLGEAGIGKSALLAVISELAVAANLLVLDGRAAEHERLVPFALVVDALDDVVATMHRQRLCTAGSELAAILPSVGLEGPSAPPPSGPGGRIQYHRALRSLLELLGRERPFALVLDDLHWADAASLEWLLHLLRRPPRVPHVLVFALRPCDAAARLVDAARAAPGWLELRPRLLDREASLAMLPPDLDRDLRRKIAADAGGNPLFLQALARLGPEAATTVPSTIAAAVRQDLDRLPPASRTLIEGAAVAGEPFDPDNAAAAADLDPADALVSLDALVAADLVRPAAAPRTFMFRHPMIRRAVYDAAPPGWRLAAHERVSTALAERGAPPVARAYHVEQYARPGDEAALMTLEQAAADSRSTSPATSARFYAAAVRLLPHGDRARRMQLLIPMAHALAAVGQIEPARATFDQAIGLLERDQDELLGNLTASAALMDHLIGDYASAERRLVAVLDGTSKETQPFVKLLLAINGFLRHDPPNAEMWVERVARRIDDQSPQILRAGHAAVAALVRIWLGQPADELLDSAERSLQATADADLARHMELGWFIGGSFFEAERYPAGPQHFRRTLRIATETRQEHLLGQCNIHLAMMSLRMLELDAALVYAECAEEVARLQSADHQLALALTARALVLLELGERAEAERAAVESDVISAQLEPNTLTWSSRARNATVRWSGDPRRLIRELEALPDLHPRIAGIVLCELVDAASAVGGRDEAHVWTKRSADRAAQLHMPLSAARAARCQATLLLAADQPLPAAELALATADRAEAGQLHQEAIASRLLAGRSLLMAGQRDRAVAVLQQTAVAAGAAGALAARDTAARELRRAGARISLNTHRVARDRAADELTVREREIADLVATGRSNKQAARELFVSEKTIEHHLSRVYAKLGVHSRTELSATLSASP